MKLLTAADLIAPNLAQLLVDVRTPSEFCTGHIPGAINIPLDTVEYRIADISVAAQTVLICKAGTRARIAAALLEPCRSNTAVLDGGMDAWYRAGQAVVVTSRTRWSLERQVRLVAGLIVLVGAAAAFALDRRWISLSGFVGLGLTFAGLTDICAMGELLVRMPWNRNSKLREVQSAAGTSCEVGH